MPHPAATLGVGFAVAAFVALALLALLGRGAHALRLVDVPGGRKRHPGPVPLTGGIALVGAVLAGPWVAARLAPDAALMVLPLSGFAIGLLDDASGKRMGAAVKALLTLGALLLAAALVEPRPAPAALAVAFLVLHAFNTSDNSNGLAGGIALVGALVLCVVPLFDARLRLPALSSAAVAGALLPFLALNYPRGRVFLGDSGSLFLGGWFAGVLLCSFEPGLLCLAAVPLVDLLSVCWLRLRERVAPWVADRRHLSHRLAQGRLGSSGAVAVLLAVQASFAALGLLLLGRGVPPRLPWPALVAALGAAVLGAVWLPAGPVRGRGDAADLAS